MPALLEVFPVCQALHVCSHASLTTQYCKDRYHHHFEYLVQDHTVRRRQSWHPKAKTLAPIRFGKKTTQGR